MFTFWLLTLENLGRFQLLLHGDLSQPIREHLGAEPCHPPVPSQVDQKPLRTESLHHWGMHVIN